MYEEDQPDPQVAAVLAELSAKDAKVAEDAEAALEWILAGDGASAITQEQIQLFCWYQLPCKWICDIGDKLQILSALAAALDLLHLPRYASICRSEVTRGILEAYEVSHAKGMAAFKKADLASGICPPDLEEFRWGSIFGIRESDALSEVASFLELAVASGELHLGSRGFKTAQQELTRSFLSAPREPSSLLEQVRAERFDAWFDSRRSSLRRELLGRIEDEVRSPTGLGEVVDPFPNMRWLMEEIAPGQALTKTGNLNRAFVQEAAARFDWRFPRPPQREDDITELWVTREFIGRLGLTRRSGTKLMLSSKGKRLASDPTGLWHAVSRGLLDNEPFPAAAGEIALAAMVDGETSYERLESTVAEAILQEGFRDAKNEPPTSHQISWAMHETLNLTRSLGLHTGTGDWRDRRYELTEIGRATAAQALWARATGPRSHPLG